MTGRQMNTDVAELGERVARALDEEKTGTLAERIEAIVSRDGVLAYSVTARESSAPRRPAVPSPRTAVGDG